MSHLYSLFEGKTEVQNIGLVFCFACLTCVGFARIFRIVKRNKYGVL